MGATVCDIIVCRALCVCGRWCATLRVCRAVHVCVALYRCVHGGHGVCRSRRVGLCLCAAGGVQGGMCRVMVCEARGVQGSACVCRRRAGLYVAVCGGAAVRGAAVR